MSREEDLVRKHLDEIATPEEQAELERLLVERPEVAELFARLSRQDGAFYRHFHEERAAESVARQIRAYRPRRRLWIAAGVAAGLLAAVFVPLFKKALEPDRPTLFLPPEGARVERGGAWIEGSHELPLHPGDRVIAAPGGQTAIRFPGGSTVLLLERASEATLGDPAAGVRVNLRKGAIGAQVDAQPPARPLVISTPHGEARVLGTNFSLAVTSDATKLDVREGRVLLKRSSDGSTIEVGADQAATAKATAKEPMVLVPSIKVYERRFEVLRETLTNVRNGYFNPDYVPYHSIETLLVDAPDYGHLSTSETFSYWLWLEAVHGRTSGDWRPFASAWRAMEDTLIPSPVDQPTNGAYDPGRPATAVSERPTPSQYPVPLDSSGPVGSDPLANELARTHGTRELYGMHWLIDVDNWYGFGRGGRPESSFGLLNTFQRGPEESVWETVPHPSWEDFKAGGPNGFLDLFIREGSYAKQWRYTCAPDADARAIQALYWASVWVPAAERSALPLGKGARMGDSLRYALRDKYFRGEPHYLIGWSYAWGGSIEPKNAWAWRSGSDQAHIGYQNPVTAWALSTVPALHSPGGSTDWARSLDRQLEFYRWQQSEEGALGGGAKVGGKEFHGMTYDPHPVFLDPPSNEWFGWQAWAMDRLAQYLLLTNDPRARPVCDKWVAWIKKVVTLNADGTYAIPSKLEWTGRPGGLHVRVTEETADVGVTGALARALVYYAAATKDEEAQTLARELLDRMWTLYRDEKGVSNPETRGDYRRFHEKVHIPEGWKGPHPPGSTFLDLRPKYKQDPDWPRVEATLAKGEAPVFRYHRFWAQVEVALANAEYARLFR